MWKAILAGVVIVGTVLLGLSLADLGGSADVSAEAALLPASTSIEGYTRAIGPYDWQFPFGTNARHLLSIEREIVAEDAGGFLCGNLGQQRHVIQQRGNIVEQG